MCYINRRFIMNKMKSHLLEHMDTTSTRDDKIII